MRLDHLLSKERSGSVMGSSESVPPECGGGTAHKAETLADRLSSATACCHLQYYLAGCSSERFVGCGSGWWVRLVGFSTDILLGPEETSTAVVSETWSSLKGVEG